MHPSSSRPPPSSSLRDARTAAERLADAALSFDAGDDEAALHGFVDALRAALDEDDAALAAAALDGAFAVLGVPDDADAVARARAVVDAGIADEARRAWDALCARGSGVHDAAPCAAALRCGVALRAELRV